MTPEVDAAGLGHDWWSVGSQESVHCDHDAVLLALRRVLTGYGVPAADAEVTAAHLVEGSVRGYPAHGVERILQITEMLDRGTLQPRPARESVCTTPATGLVDGGGGLGPPAAAEAVALVRRLAASEGVAVVGIRNCGHLGILAAWVEQIAGDDCFALMASSSEPGVVVPGGHIPLLGTNPIAYAWPTGTSRVVADFSTAAITRSELLRRADLGKPLPPATANDADGQPTCDPRSALKGGLLPFGGHKGLLVSLLASVLAGPVVGGPAGHRVAGTRDTSVPPAKADFMMAISLDAMTSGAEFRERADDFLATAENAQPGGFRVPGERSAKHRAVLVRSGFTVSARTARVLWPDGEFPSGS